MTGWELAEYEHDLAREHARTRMEAKRAARFWPPMFGLIIATAITLMAAIQGGAL